ncbi:MAG: DUF2153 family protein [Candidatus Bathyarchaeota archaeon]|nr:MAG: DUF2153 family protein [Candidatus Bathyarchaeota archaeon]
MGRMKKLSSKAKKDRLEIISSILFALEILERSVYGWKSWISNLSLMSHFTLEELVEIDNTLEKLVRPFIENDIKVAQKWIDKFPQIKIIPKRKQKEDRTRLIV